MDKILTGFLMALLCWLTSCIIGALIVNAMVPPSGTALTIFDGLVFVAIGWIVFNYNGKGEEYQAPFNIWMAILYLSTLLSI